ncbi:helix-turn-helix domain-containing protein [Kluyvera sichuanensis]|uniref:helix-turn-helix domain-containing protein n=1 Tax=Kluyvera sichuanensis TaxID=2725494 RepID=UPI0039F61B63
MYTSNYWFYQGIKCSLKDFDVFHNTDEHIDFNQRKMIFVDGNILLEGKSEDFTSFIYSNCIDRIVWLTGRDTGKVYPMWATGDRVININKSREHFSQVLRAAATELSMEGITYYARLSPTEALIFNYLAKGFSITQIAFVTDRSSKTIYQHRATILRKLGYKNVAFMQCIFFTFGKLMWTNRRPRLADISAAS